MPIHRYLLDEQRRSPIGTARSRLRPPPRGDSPMKDQLVDTCPSRQVEDAGAARSAPPSQSARQPVHQAMRGSCMRRAFRGRWWPGIETCLGAAAETGCTNTVSFELRWRCMRRLRQAWAVIAAVVLAAAVALAAASPAASVDPATILGANSIEYAGGGAPDCFGPSVLFDYGVRNVRSQVKDQLAAMAAGGLTSLRVFFVYDYTTAENQSFVPAIRATRRAVQDEPDQLPQRHTRRRVPSRNTCVRSALLGIPSAATASVPMTRRLFRPVRV